MQLINCLVALGGDERNTVPKRAITVAEAAVLQRIHGHDAIKDIEPASAGDVTDVQQRLETEYAELGGFKVDKTPGSITVTNRGELARLRHKYGNAKDEDGKPLIEALYPGAAAQVFVNLEDIGFPESCFKAISRATAAAPAKGKRKVEEPEGEDILG
jgi:hypothetical protein